MHNLLAGPQQNSTNVRAGVGCMARGTAGAAGTTPGLRPQSGHVMVNHDLSGVPKEFRFDVASLVDVAVDVVVWHVDHGPVFITFTGSNL